jgi:hypothetical protein
MRKIRNRIIIWQANRRLKRLFNESFTKGIVETIKQDREQRTNRLVENIEKFGLKDSNRDKKIDKKEDWDIRELLNGTYYHNFGSE